MHQAIPLVARAATDAHLSVLARQYHVRVGTARARRAAPAALPLQAVVDVQRAVSRHITGQNVSQRNVHHAATTVRVPHRQCQQRTRSKHGTGLVFNHARRKRQGLAPGLAHAPGDGTQGLRIQGAPCKRRIRAVKAKGRCHADDQPGQPQVHCRYRPGQRFERCWRIAQHDVAGTEQRVKGQSRAGAGRTGLAIGQHVECQLDRAGGRAHAGRGANQPGHLRPHARQQPSRVGGGDAGIRVFDDAHTHKAWRRIIHGGRHSGSMPAARDSSRHLRVSEMTHSRSWSGDVGAASTPEAVRLSTNSLSRRMRPISSFRR